jgi:DNA-binding NtrC family response regulator
MKPARAPSSTCQSPAPRAPARQTRTAETDLAPRVIPRVLIVDDDPIAAESLSDFLAEQGHDVLSATSAADALRSIEHAEVPASATQPARPVGVVLLDLFMPGVSGLEFLRTLRRQHPAISVIMLTGYGAVEAAVEALRAGATDFLTKPVVDRELDAAIQRAARQHALARENVQLKQRLDDRFGLGNIVGSDARMLRVFDLIDAVAPGRTTVLMSGESGVGKSLIAQAIHQRSPRRDKPFVQLSCGSIPETLLESELFGHTKGAFTGAYADKVGRFLAADTGTIFLDEINSASPAMQLKLLRVLQERHFEPVGSTQTIEVDARVILATNKPLEDLVAAGEFRQDLYYRINVVKIDLPPLRDRLSDIPLLASHFLEKQAQALGRVFAGFSPEALDLLRRYDYPGNIRELENIIERAAVLSRSPTIGPECLPEHVVRAGAADLGSLLGPGGLLRSASVRQQAHVESDDAPWTPAPLEQLLQEPERRIILKALKANDNNRQKTADDLAINRTTLYKKMKALGIE